VFPAQGPRLYITQIDVRVSTSGLFDRDFCEATLTTQNFVSPKLADSPTSTSRFVYCIDAAPFLSPTRFVYCLDPAPFLSRTRLVYCIDAALFLGGPPPDAPRHPADSSARGPQRRGRVYTLHITQIGVRVRTSGLIDRDFCEATLTTQNFVSPKPAISPTSTSRFVYCIDAAPFPGPRGPFPWSS
jgi:hypothetical protein